MKVSKLTYLLVIALALTFASTGCRKRPTNVTNIPGGTGKVGEGLPKGMPDTKGRTATPEPPPFSDPAPGGGNQSPKWSDPNNFDEDRGALAANTIRFDYDSAVVKGSEKSKVEAVVAYLKANPTVGLRVEGNCDERGTEEYNRALGERRALAARELIVTSGVGADRVVTVSFGKDKPEASGHDEAAHAINRRDVFVVLIPK